MISHHNVSGLWERLRSKHGRRPPVRRRTRPALEALENRLTFSVGGGWISSIQSGQSGDGLLGQYYNNSTLSGTPSFTRWDNRVDFSWTDGNAYPGGSPDPGFASVGPDNWSAKWTGTLTANFSETYTFLINSAGNGVRLWVTPVGQQQGNPLIDDWTTHGQINRHGHHDPPGRTRLRRRTGPLRDHRELCSKSSFSGPARAPPWRTSSPSRKSA